jgi:hypothetical protein
VDNIVTKTPPKGFWSFVLARFWRDGSFGDVLFHEIGHHIHATVRPEHREKEDVAEDWRKKLWGNFGRKKYWYLVPIAKPLSKLVKSFAA